jgi:hypothetical protein
MCSWPCLHCEYCLLAMPVCAFVCLHAGCPIRKSKQRAAAAAFHSHRLQLPGCLQVALWARPAPAPATHDTGRAAPAALCRCHGGQHRQGVGLGLERPLPLCACASFCSLDFRVVP